MRVPQTPEEGRGVHQALQDEAVDRSLAAWLPEARTRATIRRPDIPQWVSLPCCMPAGTGRGPGYPWKP
ncbi:MAG TPA: hypothetical protein VLT62_04475 [Candidatus Methylomirabilis sp.]|nr:hypothetical protein [Candidatus Methylomirabilis sp.]